MPVDKDGVELLLAPPFSKIARDEAVQGPAGYLFTGEDALQVDILSTGVATFTVSGVMLTERFELRPFSFQVTTTGLVASFDTFRTSVDSGWLQHVRVTRASGAGGTNKFIVYLRVCRGLTVNALVLGTLTSGWVTSLHDLYWPGGITERSTDSAGVYAAETQANPAAGADWIFSIPSGQRFQILAVSARLVASAAVANRQPRLIFDANEAAPFFEAPSVAAVTGGQTAQISWGAGAGGPVVADAPILSAPIPNGFFLTGGMRVRTSTGAIDVADQWSNIRLYCNEYIDLNP